MFGNINFLYYLCKRNQGTNKITTTTGVNSPGYQFTPN